MSFVNLCNADHVSQNRNKLEVLQAMTAISPQGPIFQNHETLPPPFWPWHRKSGHTEAMYKSMLKRSAIHDVCPGLEPPRVEARLWFQDVREAETKRSPSPEGK